MEISEKFSVNKNFLKMCNKNQIVVKTYYKLENNNNFATDLPIFSLSLRYF